MSRWYKRKLNTLTYAQPTIFDQAERKTQEGIEAAYQGADNYWKRIARDALRNCALKHQEFTVDDVTALIALTGATTGEGRAIGAIMQAASRAGMIQKTGRYRECQIPKHHRLPKSIWRSNIWRS